MTGAALAARSRALARADLHPRARRRYTAGLTLAELSALSRVSTRTIVRYEQGAEVRPAVAQAIDNALLGAEVFGNR